MDLHHILLFMFFFNKLTTAIMYTWHYFEPDPIEDSLVGTGDESLGRFLTATISVTAIRPGLTLSVVYSLVATETWNNSHGPYVINLDNKSPQFDKQSQQPTPPPPPPKKTPHDIQTIQCSQNFEILTNVKVMVELFSGIQITKKLFQTSQVIYMSQIDQWYLSCVWCVNNNSPVSGVSTITYLFQVRLLLEWAVQAVELEELVEKNYQII